MLGHDKTYKVKKGDLLEKLKANKVTHLAVFETATKKYKDRAAKALEKQLENVMQGRRFSLAFTLPKPVSYARQYDKVIGLLELTTDDVIEITPDDYTKYILDEWEWKTSFMHATMAYGAVGPTGATGATGAVGPQGYGDDVKYDGQEED